MFMRVLPVTVTFESIEKASLLDIRTLNFLVDTWVCIHILGRVSANTIVQALLLRAKLLVGALPLRSDGVEVLRDD